MWTQKKEWNENKQFKNPVKQNEGHINHLKRMFKYNPPKMYSLIIFPTDADLKNVNSIYVHDMNSAFLFIIDKIEEEKYDEQFINRVNNELKDIIDQYGITIEEHKQNINNKYTYKQ